jgi:hypothetical protein
MGIRIRLDTVASIRLDGGDAPSQLLPLNDLRI